MRSLELKLALAWAFAVTILHFVFSYAFDPRYWQVFQTIVSKIIGG